MKKICLIGNLLTSSSNINFIPRAFLSSTSKSESPGDEFVQIRNILRWKPPEKCQKKFLSHFMQNLLEIHNVKTIYQENE